MTEQERQTAPPPAKDPMKSFRGIMAGTLIIESIVVALALPVIAKLGAGISSAQGWIVIGVAVALLLCCGLLRFPWLTWVVLALQVVLMGFFFASLPSVGSMGVLFFAIWLGLFRMRAAVAKLMAQGALPSQQPSQEPGEQPNG